MNLDRYYYMLLTENKKIAYKKIYYAISSFSPSISVNGVSRNDVAEIIDGILLDNPQFFYFDLREYKYCASRNLITLAFSYLCSKNEMKSIKTKIEEKAQKILGCTTISKMSDYEKEKLIHDYLCMNVYYDHKCSNNENVHIESHTMWGVFLNQRAVCDGIAKAFKYLCNALGIKCIVARGHSKQGNHEKHAWNIVKIEGKAYQIDVTWDLNRMRGKLCPHYYFNLPDKLMFLDHCPEYQYPACTSIDYMFFKKENRWFSNKQHFIEYIKQSMLRGERVIEFRLDKKNTVKTLDTILDECFEKAVESAHLAFVNVKIEFLDTQNCGTYIMIYNGKIL